MRGCRSFSLSPFFLQLCNAPLQIRRLNRPQLQAQHRNKHSTSPRVKLARLYIVNQTIYGFPHRKCVLQSRQRIRTFHRGMTIFPVPDPA